MNTPWGHADYTETIAPGIISVSTPSHGGIKLNKERQAQLLPEAGLHNFNRSLEWWEEDCDWAVVYLSFAQEFKASESPEYYKDNMQAAIRIARTYHPEFFEAWKQHYAFPV